MELENNRRIYFLYDANGTKLQKTYYEDNRLMETTDYSGMFVYKDHHIDYIQTPEGRLKWDDHDHLFFAEYFIKDHLGNMRDVITTDPNFYNSIIQVTDYYPFGLEIHDINASDNLQLYNSKELFQQESSLSSSPRQTSAIPVLPQNKSGIPLARSTSPCLHFIERK